MYNINYTIFRPGTKPVPQKDIYEKNPFYSKPSQR